MSYFDYAATSPLLPEAYEAMLEAMQLSMAGQLGNPSSLHGPGHRAHNLIESAREQIATLINADPSEIIFTSGASEANNTVMHIFAGQHIITSDLEHPSVLNSSEKYTEQYEKIAFAELASGAPLSATPPACKDRPGKEQSAKAISRTLYSIMLANNETGLIFPIKELCHKAHQAGAYFHTDATQALGKIKVDVKALGVDYLSASAHKIGGPAGIGILYVKTGAPYTPLIYGGHQEHGRRAGTSQVINIAGFKAAAEYAMKHKTWEIYERKIRPLRDKLERRILAEIPYSRSNSSFADLASQLASSDIEARKDGPEKSQGGKAELLPNILNMSFSAAEGESIQLYLDLEGGIQVSTGSACAAGDGKPSHVLMALTHDAEIAHSSIRFSFGLDATEQDIDHIMRTLKPIISRLQGISTIKIKEPSHA